MALSSSLLLLNTSPSPLSLYAYQSHSRAFLQKQSYSCFCVQNRIKPFRLPITNKAQVDVRKEDIVIVGAGIAGLAAAVSLHRLGIGSLVLEQAESLLAGGTSLTLFKNGWRVLDAIGIGNDLRTQFLEIQWMAVKTEDGRQRRSFRFKDEDESGEENPLGNSCQSATDGLCHFSLRLAKIETKENGETLLELGDGTQLLAKIVIGCDGIRSPVAKWMGFSEPKYVGHCAFRGLGFYPNRRPFEPKLNYIYGRGLRAGYVPVSQTRVYWFICFNSPSPGPKIMDPVVLKKQAKELVSNWPEELLNIIDLTPDDTIIRTPMVDRWLWPAISPPASTGRVVQVGDAWNPMTPNLGQGACFALEDSVVLARKLASAINAGPASVEGALRSYESERWPHVSR